MISGETNLRSWLRFGLMGKAFFIVLEIKASLKHLVTNAMRLIGRGGGQLSFYAVRSSCRQAAFERAAVVNPAYTVNLKNRGA
jgi:hypothetical protein